MTGAIELEGDSLLPSNGRGPDREEMKRASMRVFVALGVVLACELGAAALEPWTDGRLPIKHRLDTQHPKSSSEAHHQKCGQQQPGPRQVPGEIRLLQQFYIDRIIPKCLNQRPP